MHGFSFQASDASFSDDYRLLVGDSKTAAIFVRKGSETYERIFSPATSNLLTLKDLIFVLTHDEIMADTLLNYLHVYASELQGTRQNMRIGPGGYRDDSSRGGEGIIKTMLLKNLQKSLCALSLGAQVYKLLPGATVDIRVIKRPLYCWKWSDKSRKGGRDSLSFDFPLSGYWIGYLDRNITFSCVAAFESGSCDIDPDLLTGAMALSSGDSIFVAAPLLCDPMENPFEYELRRIVGNVGRPGITILVPPSNLLIRPTTPENWNVITHADFDGRAEDSFKGTTLHLSFTEYNPAVILGLHGAQDAEAFVLESIVSVHDRGKWVADLDILKVIDKLVFYKQGTCDHGVGELPTRPFTSIDSWEEFLDRPVSKIGIARAHRNWVARLTLIATSLSQDLHTILCPETVCWKCFESSMLTSLPDMVVVH